MPNFIGFSTIDKDKKFTMVDSELIKRDLLNAFLIRAGQVPGRPEVGTKIWDFLFDPNDNIASNQIETEIRRIIEQDRRIRLTEVVVTSAVNTVRAHVSVVILPDESVEDFYIDFIRDTQTATII